MTEHFSGEGDVLVKKTGHHVTRANYNFTVSQPSGGRLGHIDGDVDLEGDVARRLIRDGDVLTLRLSDGRSVDFFVQAVSGFGAVNVTFTGGIQPAPQG